MNTTGGWKRRDYKRQCSICGHPWKFSVMKYIGEGKWACPDDAPGLTATQISRHNARARAVKVNAVKHARPDGVIDIYQLEEAQIFNTVARLAPWNTQADKDNGAAKSAQAAARAGVYMGDILIENTRPAVWLDTAQSVLATCVTYLLTLQYGSPTGPAAADATGVLYGGILDGSSLASGTTALAGVTFLRSYATTGNHDHLEAAKRCATFLRHQQCAWQSSASDQTTWAGATYRVEGVAAGASTAGVLSSDYWISDQGAALYFFTELAAAIGSSYSFGEASSSYFTGTTQKTLVEMSALCAAFLLNGASDVNHGNAAITGLSATTPYLRYLASSTAAGTRSVWLGGGATFASVLTDQWAMALFGLDHAGLNASQVTTVYNWLMAMTPNPANAPTGLSEAALLASAKGVYDPNIAPAVSVEASGTETTGTYYSWSASAWLASIQSVRNPAAFKAAKDTLSKPRRVNTTSIDVRYMGPLSRAGLSFQVAGLTADVATP